MAFYSVFSNKELLEEYKTLIKKKEKLEPFSQDWKEYVDYIRTTEEEIIKRMGGYRNGI